MFQIKDEWVHLTITDKKGNTKNTILSPNEIDFINQAFIDDIITKSNVLITKNYEF